MSFEYRLLNSEDVKGNISSNFVCDTSEDDYLSVITDSGVIISKICALPDNSLNKITYSNQFISISEYNLPKHLQINIDSKLELLDRFDLFECVLRSDISSCLDNCPKKKFSPISLKWSPCNTIGVQSVVAILNDAGSLDIYTKIVNMMYVNDFKHICNVSIESIQQYQSEWIATKGFNATSTFNEFKRRLDIQTPLAFTWTHKIDATFCLLCVAYRNGRITFWKLEYVAIENYKEAKIKFFKDIDTNLTLINTMYWIESNNSGLLIVGSEEGVTIFPIQNINTKSMTIASQIEFAIDDRMRIEKIISSIMNDKLYLFIIKQAFVYIYMMNQDGSVLDHCIYNAGNVNITGFHIIENTVLVLTITGVFKELKISCINERINIDWRHLYVNINWSLERAMGFCVSKNNLIYTFVSDCCKFFLMKDEKEIFHIRNYYHKAVDPLKLILNNKSNSLHNYFDCFETIRVLGILYKEIIVDRIPQDINYDHLNLLQLKTYYKLSKISQFVNNQVESVTQMFFIKPSNEIKVMIEIKLTVYYIQFILKQKEKNLMISDFKKKCLKQLITYLREVIMKDFITTYQLGNNITDELFDVMSKTRDVDLSQHEICLLCGNDIIGFCMNNHSDNRCSLTMIQIVCPKYKCPLCKRCVHSEALREFDVHMCPFCDCQLDLLISENDFIEKIPVHRDCKDDCIELYCINTIE